MDTRRRILFIDDEPNLRRVVAAGLTRFGYDVDVAEDGFDGLRRLAARRPDAIVLDVNMPGMDGFQALPEIRRRCDVPVVMLTARVELDDKVDALACGADDYLTKPFEMAELAARLAAHLRRRPAQGDMLTYEDLVMDLGGRTARRGDLDLLLSPREYDLLLALLREQGRVFRKSQLFSQVWGPQAEIGLETLDRFISLLRQKMEYGGLKRLVHTVRGVGYVLRSGAPS